MAKSIVTPTIPMGKYIQFDRETRDFAFFYDGEYLGSRSTHHIATEALNEYVYDLLKSGAMYTTTALDASTDAQLDTDEESDENPLTPEEEAAYDAANQQKVYDRIKVMFDAKNTLFVDTLPGRVNDTPIDLLVSIGIGAAMERNLSKLGITRDQLFQILHIAVNPVVDEYLITPARRMRLIWDGME